MRGRRFSFVVPVSMALVMLAAPQVSAAQSSKFVAPGAIPQLVNLDLGGGGAEGPSTDADGNVYFTLSHLAPAPRTGWIEKWTWADGKVTQYRAVEGAAIGTAIDAKGRLLVGEWGNDRITADDLKGNITVLVDSTLDGRKLLTPDALAPDRKGGVYFAEWPGFSRPGATNNDSAPTDTGGIDYISPDGKSVRQLVKIPGAHKVILSPDGKMLVVSGAGGKIWKLRVDSDGSLKDQEAFCTDCESLNVDPVAFDEDGNVYLTGEKIYVYSPTGDRLEVIDLHNRFSNLAFGGKDRKTLIATGHVGVYTLQMAVKGAPLASGK